MKTAPSLRDRLRAQLADLKMPGALEALDDILGRIDGGHLKAPEALEALLGAQITLRNNRRLEAAMRSSRLPAVKTLADFDFSFQPSLQREQIDSLAQPWASSSAGKTSSCSGRRASGRRTWPSVSRSPPPRAVAASTTARSRPHHLARGGSARRTPEPAPQDPHLSLASGGR